MPHDPITTQYIIVIMGLIVSAFVAGIGVGITIASDKFLHAHRKGGAA